MGRLGLFLLILLSSSSCGHEEEDTDILRFSNCSLVPICDTHHRYGNHFPTCSPDGNNVVFYDLGQLWSVPAAGGEKKIILNTIAERLYLSFCPVTAINQLVFIEHSDSASLKYSIRIFSLTSGAVKTIKSFEEEIGYTSWSHDGMNIFFVKLSGTDRRKGIYAIPSEG